MNKLANYKGLKKSQSDAEFSLAYAAASQVVSPLVGLSREDQLYSIMSQLRTMAENEIVYSTSVSHYNDPYGYFVLKVASCSGCARATGLCLNMLGIPYEHVNEGQWSHQWCRVPMPDGSFWICDAYGYYCGPEPALYQHPRV